jgi:hypothetical protein
MNTVDKQTEHSLDWEALKKIVDDILIHALSFEALVKRTTQVLRKCDEANITLSQEKAQIGQSVKFAGFIVCNDGIKT